MNGILTAGQAGELHKAIAAYLVAANAPQTFETLREEINLPGDFDEAAAKRYEGILEKKWTGIARLQRKITDLEKQVTSLQAELEASPSVARSKNQDPVNWLPKPSPAHTFEQHRNGVTCVAFHPVFTSLASGSEDFTIKIWDWELGECEKTLKGHIRAVSGLDYGGPKGNILLASCSSDLTIKLWDPSKEYANIRTLSGHDHSVSAVRFLTTNENHLVSASRDGTLRIWDVLTGFCVKVIKSSTESWIRDVAPSFDGKWLVSGGRDQAVTVWEVSSGEPKAALLGHDNFIECCVFAPPASYKHLASLAGLKKPPPDTSSCEFIATGARDKTIKIWEARGRLIKTIIGHDNWIRGLLFHPGGKYLFSVSDDKTLRCWDLSQECRQVKVIDDTHGHFVSCIRWAPSPNSDNADPNGEKADGASKKDGGKPSFRCVIATGSADSCVRVFT